MSDQVTAVKLIGTDGNVFAIVGTVCRALENDGRAEYAKEFVAKVENCGSYDEVLRLIIGDESLEVW